MPGMSNRTTSRSGLSALTNGSSSSRRAPMPLHRTSGGHLGLPVRTETRRRRPPAISVPVAVRGGELMARARRRPARPLFPGPPGWSGSAVIDLAAGAGSGCRCGWWWPCRRDPDGLWVRLSWSASFRNASACSADAPPHQGPGHPPARSACRAGNPLLPAQPPGVAGGRAIRPVQLRPRARSIRHK